MRWVLRLAAAATAAGAWLVVGAHAAPVEALVADLSNHLIAITTGFTGTEVVLFGAVDGPGSVAVVVQGPAGEVVVRRKERVVGIWLNSRSLVFDHVPSFYVVATNRPIERIAGEAVLERHAIGLDHLRLDPRKKTSPEEARLFRTALVRNRQEAGLYGDTPGQVIFLGEHLFRTTVSFPANVPTGVYTVSVYLLRNGDVVSAQTTPLVVSKAGFSAEVYELAHRLPVWYGIGAVLGAVAAGWLAGAIFRRGSR
jgi:uncharacterized protein (TIGR02186 family)